MKAKEFTAHPITRRETTNLRVLVTPEEREAILAMAKGCGLSVSAYLRNLGLGYAPVSALDMAQADKFLDTCTEQTRLGNLLKMFLIEREKYNETQLMSVARLLEKLEESQTRLLTMADSIMRVPGQE